MHLKHPFGPFLGVLASIKGGYIVNPAAMQHEQKKDGKGDWAQAWLAENTNGTGAYKVVKWDKGQQLVLQRNPDYWDNSWDPAKAIDRVIVQIIREDVGRRLALTSGQADFLVRSLSPEEFDQVKADPKVETQTTKSLHVFYMSFNLTDGPTANKKFREAIVHAFDYEGNIKHVLRGHAARIRGPLPPNMPGYNAETPMVNRDLNKARQLLKESGVDLAKVELELNFTPGVRYVQQMNELLQSNLAEIGIKARLASSTYLTMLAKWKKPETRGAIYSNRFPPDIADPYAVLDASYATAAQWNLNGYANAEMDSLLKIGREATDPAKRMEAYRKAQVLAAQDFPAIFTHQVMGLFAYNKKVHGVTPNPTRFEGWYFREMYVEQ